MMFCLTDRQARERVKSCGLADRVTVICTEITRDQYMSQLVEYLRYYGARFNTVFSLIPSGDGLIHFVLVLSLIDHRLCNTRNSSQWRAPSQIFTLFVVIIVYRLVIRF